MICPSALAKQRIVTEPGATENLVATQRSPAASKSAEKALGAPLIGVSQDRAPLVSMRLTVQPSTFPVEPRCRSQVSPAPSTMLVMLSKFAGAVSTVVHAHCAPSAMGAGATSTAKAT